MAAMTSTETQEVTGLFGKQLTNTNNRHYKLISVEGTAAAASDTLDLNTLVPCSGIMFPLKETFNNTGVTLPSTWTGTTITLAGQSAGPYRAWWVVYS